MVSFPHAVEEVRSGDARAVEGGWEGRSHDWGRPKGSNCEILTTKNVDKLLHIALR
jgi:hypothetical protein